MSFYTSLTGLNAATTQLSVTSNNIANVATTGFKRSRADFGDIFATSPLQKASTVVGKGTTLKQVSQEFSQGNIELSGNTLDLAVTGEGFFPLKSADGQDLYTRNGSFLLDDKNRVVNSAGQFLNVATVDSLGKADFDSPLQPLQIQTETVGEAVATSEIGLAINFPADGEVATFVDDAGFEQIKPFDPNDPTTYAKSSAITIYDDNGNDFLLTTYYARTQVATAEDPENKWQSYVYLGDQQITPALSQATSPSGEPLWVDKYGRIESESAIPAQSRSTNETFQKFNLDDLSNPIESIPAEIDGGDLSLRYQTGEPEVTINTTNLNTTIPLGSVDESGNAITTVEDQIGFDLRNAFTLAVDVPDTVTSENIADYEVTVDLSSLQGQSFSGKNLAQEVTRELNRQFGSQAYFDLSEDPSLGRFAVSSPRSGAQLGETITVDVAKQIAADNVTRLANGEAVISLSEVTPEVFAQALKDQLNVAGVSTTVDSSGNSTVTGVNSNGPFIVEATSNSGPTGGTTEIQSIPFGAGQLADLSSGSLSFSDTNGNTISLTAIDLATAPATVGELAARLEAKTDAMGVTFSASDDGTELLITFDDIGPQDRLTVAATDATNAAISVQDPSRSVTGSSPQSGYYYPLYTSEAEAIAADDGSGPNGPGAMVHTFDEYPGVTFYMPNSQVNHAAPEPDGSTETQVVGLTSAQVEDLQGGQLAISVDGVEALTLAGEELRAGVYETQSVALSTAQIESMIGGTLEIESAAGNSILAVDSSVLTTGREIQTLELTGQQLANLANGAFEITDGTNSIALDATDLSSAGEVDEQQSFDFATVLADLQAGNVTSLEISNGVESISLSSAQLTALNDPTVTRNDLRDSLEAIEPDPFGVRFNSGAGAEDIVAEFNSAGPQSALSVTWTAAGTDKTGTFTEIQAGVASATTSLDQLAAALQAKEDALPTDEKLGVTFAQNATATGIAVTFNEAGAQTELVASGEDSVQSAIAITNTVTRAGSEPAASDLDSLVTALNASSGSSGLSFAASEDGTALEITFDAFGDQGLVSLSATEADGTVIATIPAATEVTAGVTPANPTLGDIASALNTKATSGNLGFSVIADTLNDQLRIEFSEDGDKEVSIAAVNANNSDLTVDFNGSSAIQEVAITDADVQALAAGSLVISDGTNTLTLDADDLPDGVSETQSVAIAAADLTALENGLLTISNGTNQVALNSADLTSGTPARIQISGLEAARAAGELDGATLTISDGTNTLTYTDDGSGLTDLAALVTALNTQATADGFDATFSEDTGDIVLTSFDTVGLQNTFSVSGLQSDAATAVSGLDFTIQDEGSDPAIASLADLAALLQAKEDALPDDDKLGVTFSAAAGALNVEFSDFSDQQALDVLAREADGTPITLTAAQTIAAVEPAVPDLETLVAVINGHDDNTLAGTFSVNAAGDGLLFAFDATGEQEAISLTGTDSDSAESTYTVALTGGNAIQGEDPRNGIESSTLVQGFASVEAGSMLDYVEGQGTQLTDALGNRLSFDVSYSLSEKGFSITRSDGADLTLQSAVLDGAALTNTLFGLSGSKSRDLDANTGLFVASSDFDVFPNGEPIVDPMFQRYGLKVEYDEAENTFSIKSGTTGDDSNIRMYNVSGSVQNMLGFVTAQTSFETADLRVDGKEETDLAERGLTSEPARVAGNPLSINVDSTFEVTDLANEFSVTVDNVTETFRIPEGTYNLNEFIGTLEKRINAMADESGRTVNGVTVTYDPVSEGLVFQTGTTGNEAFIQVSGSSRWGLDGLNPGLGKTSTFIQPETFADANDLPAPVFVRFNNETGQWEEYSASPELNMLELSETQQFDATRQPTYRPLFLDKGELTFDTSGNLVSPLTGVELDNVVIGGSGNTLEIDIDYSGSTQFTGEFSVNSQSQNGQPNGSLVGLDIGDDGLVTASYSNGSQQLKGKIILANFSTPNGLRQLGDSTFLESAESGAVTLAEPGSAGVGTIRAGARERANLDLTSELVDLITAQRNFQANAKGLETSTTLTQTIINIRG